MSIHSIAAFPSDSQKDGTHKGMTLFDVISTQALTAVIAAHPEISAKEAAEKAVAYADALLLILSSRASEKP
jgi:hypothetical protein